MNNYIHVTIHASYIPWPPSLFTSLVHCWPCPSPGLRVLQGAKMIFVLGLTVSGRCHQHLWIVVIHPIWGVGESVQCSVQWENVQIAIDFSDHPNSEHDEHADPKHRKAGAFEVCWGYPWPQFLGCVKSRTVFLPGKGRPSDVSPRGRPSLPFSWRYTWASKGQNWAFHIHYLAKNFGLPSGSHGNWKWLLDYAGWNNHLEIGHFHHCFRPRRLKLGHTSGS